MPCYDGRYDRELKPFFDAMRYKLMNNSHRGQMLWEDMKLEDLFKFLEGELAELKEAISLGNQVEVLLEAADVGNYAMMIAHVAIKNARGNR